MPRQNTAIITGGSKGIGRACVNKFLQENFNVFSCARNVDPFDEILKAYPNHLNVAKCDLSNTNELLKWMNELTKQIDHVDVLINNAGIFIPGNLMDEADGHLENMMQINLFATYHACRAIVPTMKKQKNGHIFNICSIASLKAYPQGGSYSISKFAQYGLTKNLRHELKEDNIKVTAVLPGATYTDSWSGANLPKERFVQTDDLANLIWSCYQNNTFATVEDLVIRPQLGDL
ncbi:MAG: SDR family oxidoreductase [Bacteroidota bacterium]|nr:SDR family oxidoreductase [Bacteroidota bacterium]